MIFDKAFKKQLKGDRIMSEVAPVSFIENQRKKRQEEEKIKDVFEDGPGISKNEMWGKAEKRFSNGGLPGITCKMEIGNHDVYLKTSWLEGRIVRIDITLSRGDRYQPVTEKEISLSSSIFDNARYDIETICKHASELLQSGAVGIKHVVDDWMGRRGYPNGYCPQIPAIGESGEKGPTYQKGPMDAAAKLILMRANDWKKMIMSMEG